VFAYTVTMQNTGNVPARLLGRRWLITDANGKTIEVVGEGVVGEHPYLRPGEAFQYTSSTMIETPVGSMQGSYQLLADDGVPFEAPIPPFRLAIPRTLH
jgi:ApaG protein